MHVFEPENRDFADTNAAIVLFNQFGATVSQDNGRDAQVLADKFSLPVLAVDRPGTAGVIPHKRLASRLSTPDGYLAEMAQLGKNIDRQVEAIGIDTIITTGRSADALGALALARSETVSNLGFVFAPEPIACEQVPSEDGFKHYKDYLKQQKELLDAATSEELVKPLPPGLSLFPAIGRLVSIPPAMLFDKFHNQGIFASNASCHHWIYTSKLRRN